MNKKAYQTIKNRLFLIGVVCLSFFVFGCGLDVYTVIPSPFSTNNVPVYTTEYDYRYFSFFTNEKGFDNDGSVKFQGTEIYYKIYSNYSNMVSQTEKLQSLASSDDTSSSASSTLITTYGYKALKAQNYTDSPLIPYKGENQSVYIRLTDYLDIEDYSARILVNGSSLLESASRTIPIRNVSDGTTFNFGRSGTLDVVPKSGDDDVNYTSMSDGNKWYIAMFAVAVGMDYLYTPYYSNILYLGAVTIDADSQNN